MKKLSELINKYSVTSIKNDLVMQFGDRHDGAIEFPGLVDNGVIEVGYFYGDVKKKNIIVISSQVGCPAHCQFCELGNERFARNLSALEIYDQIMLMLQIASRSGIDIDEIKHKINVAKCGESLLNDRLIEALEMIIPFSFSIKVSTIFPGGTKAWRNFHRLAMLTAIYPEPIQIQLSLVSTDEKYRRKAIGLSLASFKEIRQASEDWFELNPKGRKINLSLILTDKVPVDVNQICDIFPSNLFHFRFRNYVPTFHGQDIGLKTISINRFEAIKKSFADKGYEVGDWATPSPMEQKFHLASNVTRRRYLQIIDGKF